MIDNFKDLTEAIEQLQSDIEELKERVAELEGTDEP
jgi:prefoldin subunit 5